MNNIMGKMDSKEIKIQGLLDGYLKKSSSINNLEKADHLDEDTLTAFVEGTLNEREAKPITNHLVGCSFCRHITTELVKLDLVFAEEAQPIVVSEAEPTKGSAVLNGILSRIFGTSDGAVFAHQESEEETSEKSDKKDQSEDE